LGAFSQAELSHRVAGFEPRVLRYVVCPTLTLTAAMATTTRPSTPSTSSLTCPRGERPKMCVMVLDEVFKVLQPQPSSLAG